MLFYFRECPNCQEKFSSLRTYQLHLQSKCGALSFVCHICGLVSLNRNNSILNLGHIVIIYMYYFQQINIEISFLSEHFCYCL